MWWEASKDTLYTWYVNSKKLNRNDAFNKFHYTLKNDILKIFYMDFPATDSTGSEYGRVISKSFFRK